MAKKTEQNRLLQQQDSLALEQTSVSDDSLLPSADELKKLNDINPDIINWILNRTEIEQNARIKFNENKLDLLKKGMKSTERINILCVVAAFLVIVGGLALSAIFIWLGKDTSGTIFGGTSLVLMAAVFLQWKKSKKD